MPSNVLRPLALLALAAFPSILACAPSLNGPVRDVSADVLAPAPNVYGPDASAVPAAARSARVRGTFEGALTPEAKATLAHEAALDTVAAAIAETVAREGHAPSRAIVEWLAWRAGAVSRIARVAMMTTAGVDDLDFQTSELAGKMQASVYPEAFGIARSTRGRPAQAVVFARRLLEVDPIAKAFAPGAPIAIKVKPVDAFTELVVHADDARGGVADAPMIAAGDGSFSVALAAPQVPGRYFVEITGLDARTSQSAPENPWRRVLFLAPIYVGVAEPSAPDEVFRAPSSNPPDVTAWSTRVLDVYNEARAKAGKKPLALDGRLTALAQERSGVVARAGRDPGPDVVLADKLAAAGSPPRDYDERHARVDSLSDYVHLRLLEPVVRRRVLASDTLLLGIGVTPSEPNAKGEIEATVVEDDVEPVARLDPARDRARVIAALDAPRSAEGRAAFEHDDDVAKVVQAFADDVCHGAKRPNQMKPLVDKARGIGEKFHQWGTPVWHAGYDFTRWQAASLLAKSKEAPLSHVEVGLCQGDLPGKPGGSYVVVIAYGP